MNGEPGVIQTEPLAQAEAVYRRRLTNEPDDMAARVNLAWCLFMQALHEAGRESAMANGLQSGGTSMNSDPRDGHRVSPSHAVLLECLRQTNMVAHLSQSDQDHRDV